MASYGKDTIIRIIAICILLILIAVVWSNIILSSILIFISIFLFSFTLYFFRDPERFSSVDDGKSIISPADGKVVLIKDAEMKSNDFFQNTSDLKQISIFLSPLNVHVNRIPLTGEITFYNYVKGDYIVAFDDKASDRNERSEVGLVSKTSDKILFKQIAGFVARRIVCDVKIGNKFKAGDRYGMIKFGSRMDLIFKKDSDILVNIGDKVIAGETIIEKLK